MARVLETDYLIVGCGAMGMAFADALIAESTASVVIVDRHAAPGGHWNDAYPFVRLHQPSRAYGVNSLPLGRDSIDTDGLNRGHYELASGPEVRAYFDRVMHERLLASGRVQYFPTSSYLGDHRFVELGSGDEHIVRVRRSVVDATYTNTEVPSTHPPRFAVAPGVRCVPVNDLARLEPRPRSGYVIIGAGKTAMDAVLWLLQNEVEPDAIRWIRPHDAWLIDRTYLQPEEKLSDTIEGMARTMEAAAKADDVAELFQRLSASGQLLRIDEDVTPTHYRCAIVARAELAGLRRIRNVVRLGRVQRIEPNQIVLERGTMPTDGDWLHVDCTANGLERRRSVPVFATSAITLQSVRACQPTFSAALIGHIEATCDDLAEKAGLCSAIPYPEKDTDWLRIALTSAANQHAWSKNDALRDWIERSRLNVYRGTREAAEKDEHARRALQRYRDHLKPALGKLQRFSSELGER